MIYYSFQIVLKSLCSKEDKKLKRNGYVKGALKNQVLDVSDIILTLIFTPLIQFFVLSFWYYKYWSHTYIHAKMY